MGAACERVFLKAGGRAGCGREGKLGSLHGGCCRESPRRQQLATPGWPRRLPRPQMATQLTARPLFETGMQARCSQLHAARLVLLGDAAHAVSPATSSGMNAALEDALVLSAVSLAGGSLA